MRIMDENMTFEVAMAELSKIVSALESGNVSLEESLKKYEDGIKYVRICSSCLENAKLIVEELNASLVEKPEE